MTNITTLMTLTVTNWSVSTHTNQLGRTVNFEQGRRATNWVASFDFEGQKKQFILKSANSDYLILKTNTLPISFGEALKAQKK